VLIAAVGNSFGKPLLVSGANVTAAVAGAGLIWLLTSRYGLLGAACSAVLSALVLLVVQGVVFQVRIRENRG
jgi:O-antigen/teichoic acid export membrane protein